MATREHRTSPPRPPPTAFPASRVDGNDVLAVWQAAGEAVDRARAGEGPTLIEVARPIARSGITRATRWSAAYRTQEELDLWTDALPDRRLPPAAAGIGPRHARQDLAAIEAAVDKRRAGGGRVRAAARPVPIRPRPSITSGPSRSIRRCPYADPAAKPRRDSGSGLDGAVRDGIAEEMRRDPHIIYLGEGTGERGGSFGHTKELWHEFGAERMIDTPICELGFTGAAIGASASGCRAVADLMFVDFLFEAASQIIQQAAKLRYMSNGQLSVPMIVRASWGTVKMHRPAPQRRVSSGLGPLPGLDRRRAFQSGRRQGPDENGPARQRSGAVPRAQGAVRRPRARCPRANTSSPSA